MKNIILFTLALFLFQTIAFAQEALTPAQQEREIERLSKGFRSSMWSDGYEDVTSNFRRFDRAQLDNYVSPERRFLAYPNSSEIEASYNCLDKKYCELYQVSVSSTYYSGYGVDGYLVALDILTGKSEVFFHTIYQE